MQAKVMTVRLALVAATLVAAVGIARADTAAGAEQADTTTSIRPSQVVLKPSAQEGVLVFASPDGMFKWWFDARVNLDATFFAEDKNSLGDAMGLRRARFALKSITWRDWYSEVDVDWADEAVAMKDAYLRYDNVFGRSGYVKVGNFKSPFGMEELTSSRYLMFAERSQGLDAFLPGRKVGVSVAYANTRYRLEGGAFGPDVSQYTVTSADENFNFIGRANANFFRSRQSVLHVGVAGASMWPQFEGSSVRFKGRNEYDMNDYKYLDTDNIQNVNRYELIDGELAYQYHRLRLQGEQIAVRVKRTVGMGSPDLDFGGGYVCASLFLTHDAYPYEWKAAQFQRVIPRGKHGALEVATRFSTVNLEDHDVLGGKSGAFTVGVNWYPNPTVKLMCDFVMINNDKYANAKGSLIGNDDFNFVTFRFATAF